MEPLEQESDRIERHIEQTREKLGRNLNELETRVRTTLDWRGRYERNPWAVLGIAFGAGAALTAATAGRRTSGSNANYRADNIQVDINPRSTTLAPPSRLTQAWGQIQDALLSTATRHAETFLAQAVPGFAEEYRKTNTRTAAPNRTPDDVLR